MREYLNNFLNNLYVEITACYIAFLAHEFL